MYTKTIKKKVKRAELAHLEGKRVQIMQCPRENTPEDQIRRHCESHGLVFFRLNDSIRTGLHFDCEVRSTNVRVTLPWNPLAGTGEHTTGICSVTEYHVLVSGRAVPIKALSHDDDSWYFVNNGYKFILVEED